MATPEPGRGLWSRAAWIVPLLLILAFTGAFLWINPIGTLREVPPVEALAVERTVLNDGEIVLQVRNDGPNPVRVAQVLVNDAYWNFEMSDRELSRLEAETIRIDYPWDEGLPLHIALVTSTGVTVEHEIEAAALTPEPDSRTLAVYSLLGVYIGVVPIAIGLLWFPSLARASEKWVGFFLALTLGLLVFLLVETVAEGLELANETGAALNGIGLFAIGTLVAVVGLVAVESELRRRSHRAGLVLAYFIAAGIGLHNLGEGLAVGAALAAGEVALGTSLVIGFALHNTTEGLAIVAPVSSDRKRPSLWHFAALGAIAGVPTILGAWFGGFAFAPASAAVAFGLAAGAIAQVVWAIARSMRAEVGVGSRLGALGFVGGLVLMYASGLLTV